jgi:hypothetical protein
MISSEGLRFASKPGFIPCRSIGDCYDSMLALCHAHKKEIIAQKLERFKQVSLPYLEGDTSGHRLT